MPTPNHSHKEKHVTIVKIGKIEKYIKMNAWLAQLIFSNLQETAYCLSTAAVAAACVCNSTMPDLTVPYYTSMGNNAAVHDMTWRNASVESNGIW